MPNSNTTAPLRVYLRYGIARKKLVLKDARRTYDGLVLPGNILLYQYRGTPSVVLMCEKPYFVDPMSYLFGQPYESFKRRTKTGEAFKPSFVRLLEGHGLDESHIELNYKELLQYLRREKKALPHFISRALDFQQCNVLQNLDEEKDVLSDDQRKRLEDGSLYPEFLVPPYFLYSESPDGFSITTDLNRRILQYCWEDEKLRSRIFPMVFVPRPYLETDDSSSIDIVTQIARAHEFSGYCIWVDAFDERRTTETLVTNLIRLVRGLSSGGRRIVILRGGFFSLLLYHFGVDTVCHGLAYGETQAVGDAARRLSGAPPIRYYFPRLHIFMTLENALSVLRERKDLLCPCPVCRRVLGGNPERVMQFQEQEAFAELHFLWNRSRERDFIRERSLEQLSKDLQDSHDLGQEVLDILTKVGAQGDVQQKSAFDPSYLNAWKTALEHAVAPTSGAS